MDDPAILLTQYVLSTIIHTYFNHEHTLQVCLVRFTAGILVVIYEHKPSTAVMIASTILLNAGVFPLVAATMGLIRIM